jgi:hypothetical protein
VGGGLNGRAGLKPRLWHITQPLMVTANRTLRRLCPTMLIIGCIANLNTQVNFPALADLAGPVKENNSCLSWSS